MQLAAFRMWSYAALSAHIGREGANRDCLEHFEGTSSDGTDYQLEFNAFWDDKPHGDIRVCGSLSAEPQRQLLGFLPIYIPHLTDSFIMSPDGSFVDEEEIDEDQAIDRISDKIADRLVSKLIRWAVRTILGLALFGTLWYFYDWAFWLFWGYVITAPISLGLQIYLYFKLVKMISQGLADPDS